MIGIISITAVCALVLGILIGRFLLQKIFKQMEVDANQKANQIIKQAQEKAQDILQQEKNKADHYLRKLRTEQDAEFESKKNLLINNEKKLKSIETRIKQSENKLKQKETNFTKIQETLNKDVEEVQKQKIELTLVKEDLQKQIEKIKKDKEWVTVQMAEAEELKKQQIGVLEKIAELKVEEARNQLIELIADEARSEASTKARQILEEAKMGATKEARRIVLSTIQRTATEHAIENCVSVFHLESDDIKGKIIGREGRNIRALEAATGVEIIVDDTPEAITISGFDPIRREVARLSLHRLVTDGRIHPARIEEVVAKTQADLEEQVIEIGERTVIELGIHGLHPELIKLVGKMRFRSSYGQNLLQHSREVAKLCAIMAAELGLNAKLAKRAGLLHDIGKVYTEDMETPHAILGMELAKRYNEHPEVCNAIGAHHDEIEMTSTISPIIQACDAISGSRPGARRETMESYLQRLHDLEALATSYDGVNKCFAIQAGRELRVIVDAENVTDVVADELSFKIAQKIEKEMQYPGQIKVTVIREKRSINFAK